MLGLFHIHKNDLWCIRGLKTWHLFWHTMACQVLKQSQGAQGARYNHTVLAYRGPQQATWPGIFCYAGVLPLGSTWWPSLITLTSRI